MFMSLYYYESNISWNNNIKENIDYCNINPTFYIPYSCNFTSLKLMELQSEKNIKVYNPILWNIFLISLVICVLLSIIIWNQRFDLPKFKK